MIKLINRELDGKKIAFSTETEFHVQIGKGKGSYKTIATFKGDLAAAVVHYNGMNMFVGWKKRLYAPSMNNPILARHIAKEIEMQTKLNQPKPFVPNPAVFNTVADLAADMKNEQWSKATLFLECRKAAKELGIPVSELVRKVEAAYISNALTRLDEVEDFDC